MRREHKTSIMTVSRGMRLYTAGVRRLRHVIVVLWLACLGMGVWQVRGRAHLSAYEDYRLVRGRREVNDVDPRS